MHETLKKLKKHAEKKLDEFADRGLRSGADIAEAKDLVSMLYKLCCMMEDEGYSGGYDMYARDVYARGDSYRDDYSGRRGRGRDGRFVSRDDGRERMTSYMDDMMSRGDLSPDEERTLRRAMSIIREA